jgi:hypothetical protein
VVRSTFFLGFIAVLAQLIGILVAQRTPIDNQGYVAKTFAVFGVQAFAVPVALIGLIVGVVGMLNRSHLDRRIALGWGIALCIVGLIPMGLVYIKLL